MAELLPWLQLLLVPVVGLLMGIKSELASISATQASHADRLQRLERFHDSRQATPA